MYHVESLGEFTIGDRGKGFTTHSPVSCERNLTSFREAVGDEICIDGNPYKIKAVEMFMPGTPLSVGEEIGILVGGDDED